VSPGPAIASSKASGAGGPIDAAVLKVVPPSVEVASTIRVLAPGA
jgi:hypothetical protein